MRCTVHPLGSLGDYRYVVTFSFYENRLVLSRHRERSTWETQGGHIEAGETPLMAARRELWEESGAAEYDLTPLCDYRAEDEKGFACGQVDVAQIHSFAPLPPLEMAERRTFDTLPSALTYPQITPVLLAEAMRKGKTYGIYPG